ncbi:uncharacterized protein [Antedon mediterranea]|uniref:uncharacterized protein n=1 Tax=Antedon mediterranea TaxID=105859 RepID=UPI003AF86AE5
MHTFRPFQRWVDFEVYLNKIDPDDWSQDWILPMIPDEVFDFEELEKIRTINREKKIPTAFFMERPNEAFSTFHHEWAGCERIDVTCLRGELFYKNDQNFEEQKLVPGMSIKIPLSTKYALYTADSPAVWMYEYYCNDGNFHIGMDMMSVPGWLTS